MSMRAVAMNFPSAPHEVLLRENAELRERLAEAEETLSAIRFGEVDALIVGDDIYTLDSANAAANAMRKDVLSQMEDAVMAFDVDDHVIYLNPAAERQYGKSASDVLGRAGSELFMEHWPDTDTATDIKVSSQQRLQQSGMYRAQSIHRRHDGRDIHVEATVARLSDCAGQVVGRLCVVRDIGERIRTDEAMRNADRRKDEFLATLAHELRNPLAPIRHSLQIMRLTQGAENPGALDIVERQLQQMVHLVDDLLDVSRISQGKVVLRRETMDLRDAVMAAVETSRPLIERARHRLDIELAPAGELTTSADATRVCQIVANLLNNAAKYTPQNGHIRLATARERGHAVITVQDSGIGIGPEVLPRVFDMFTQVDHTLHRAQGGLGIGLALVKKLVEMHGGSVAAHSDGPGKGCTFVVRIPLASTTVDAPVAELPVPVLHHDPANVRVLVVDDNADSAESLLQLLRIWGYQTCIAFDGIEATEAAESFLPHVAVLDLGLPRMSGLEVARHIKQQDWGHDMALIALSGWGQESDRAKTTEAGFVRHFVKPVDLDRLSGALVQLTTGPAPVDTQGSQGDSKPGNLRRRSDFSATS
ncbi:MAG: hybrid sensor histidine kinase/response regulator [Panacagrimonas sp.]